MKLKSLYSFLLATALVACNEDFNEGIAGIQTADPESPAAAVTFSATAASATTIDLGALAEGTTTVKVCSFTATPSTETTTVTHVLDLRDAENNSYDVDLNANGEAAVADLQAVIETVYNKRPVERTFDAYVYEFLNTDGQSLIGKSEKITVIMTPKAPVIETAYYLIGGMNGWVADKAEGLLKLNHSGKDVYDDAVFSTILEVGPACYWKIIPQSVVDKLNSGEIATVWDDESNILGGAGADGNTEPTGSLVIGSKSAMQIEEGGWVKISLDMMEYTYKVEMLGDVTPYLYVVGDHIDGWNPALANYIYSPDFMSYYGYANLKSSFKLTSEQSWNGKNYGYASDETMSVDPGAGNLWVAAPGFYYIQADITAMTWKATEITTYGLIGDATAGGWDASTPMTFDATTSTYTVTTALGEGSFKFRANDGWDINLGGNLNDLTPNGDNISVTEGAGTYTITLDLSDAAQFKATIVKE